MVAGYHLIWTAYGFWLPNDIRGSTSSEVRVAVIKTLGGLHFGRKQQQPSSRQVREFQQRAHDVLKHPVLTLGDDDTALIGESFAVEIATQGYVCYACAIMPDHAHLLIRRHRDRAETMIERFQEASRLALIDNARRAPTHPVWTKGGWKGFLNTQEDFERTIEYIKANPREIGKPEQVWKFVSAYDGWLP